MSSVEVSDSPAPAVFPQSSLEGAIAAFLLDRQARGVTPSRMATLHVMMREWQSFCTGHQIEKLADVTRSVLREYALSLQQSTDRKVTTLNLRIIAVKAFLRFLLSEELVAKDLSRSIKVLPEDHKDIEPLTPEQVSALIGQASCQTFTGLRNRLILQLLYDTGMRVAELVGLSIQDIDLEQHLIRIRKGKGRRQRLVPFGRDCGESLQRFLNARGNLEHDVLFVTRDRRPHLANGLNRAGVNLIQKMLARYARKAKVPRSVHPHLVRHTFAVHYLRRNPGELFKLQAIMGHSDLSMARRYWHVAERDLQSGSSPLDHLHAKWIATAEPTDPARELAGNTTAGDESTRNLSCSDAMDRIAQAEPDGRRPSSLACTSQTEVESGQRADERARLRARLNAVRRDLDEMSVIASIIEGRRTRLEEERDHLEAQLAGHGTNRVLPTRPRRIATNPGA